MQWCTKAYFTLKVRGNPRIRFRAFRSVSFRFHYFSVGQLSPIPRARADVAKTGANNNQSCRNGKVRIFSKLRFWSTWYCFNKLTTGNLNKETTDRLRRLISALVHYKKYFLRLNDTTKLSKWFQTTVLWPRMFNKVLLEIAQRIVIFKSHSQNTTRVMGPVMVTGDW